MQHSHHNQTVKPHDMTKQAMHVVCWFDTQYVSSCGAALISGTSLSLRSMHKAGLLLDQALAEAYIKRW